MTHTIYMKINRLTPPAPRHNTASAVDRLTQPAPSNFVPTVASAPYFYSADSSSNDPHCLYENKLSHSSSSPPQHGFCRDFISKLLAEYPTLDTRRVPRVRPLQLSAHTDRTAATQLLVHSMRDALSEIFDVAHPSGSVTVTPPTWVSGWHAPLLKFTKTSIVSNRDDTHTLHRLVNDLFT